MSSVFRLNSQIERLEQSVQGYQLFVNYHIKATGGFHSDVAPPTKLTILAKLEILPAFTDYFI